MTYKYTYILFISTKCHNLKIFNYIYICIRTFNLFNLMLKSHKISLTVLIHIFEYKINKIENKNALYRLFLLRIKKINKVKSTNMTCFFTI